MVIDTEFRENFFGQVSPGVRSNPWRRILNAHVCTRDVNFIHRTGSYFSFWERCPTMFGKKINSCKISRVHRLCTSLNALPLREWQIVAVTLELLLELLFYVKRINFRKCFRCNGNLFEFEIFYAWWLMLANFFIFNLSCYGRPVLIFYIFFLNRRRKVLRQINIKLK